MGSFSLQIMACWQGKHTMCGKIECVFSASRIESHCGVTRVNIHRTLLPVTLLTLLILASGWVVPAMATDNRALTVTSEFTMPDSAADTVEGIRLLSILGEQPTERLLSIEWRRQETLFGFISWTLCLTSETGLLSQSPGSELRVQSEPQGEMVELRRIAPQVGHTYTTTLAFDAATGDLSLLIVDRTDGSMVYSLQTRVGRYPHMLEAGVVAEQIREIRKERVFLPVGVQWEVLSGEDANDLLSTVRLSKQRLAAVDVTLATTDPEATVQVVAELEGRRAVWGETPLVAGRVRLPLDADHLEPGAWSVGLELVREGATWPLGIRRTITVTEGQVVASVPELKRRHGEVRGRLRVSGDGDLPGTKLRVYADILRMVDGEWKRVEEDAVLWEGTLDVSEVPSEVPFSLGNRIDRDWAHRVQVRVGAASDQGLAVVSNAQEYFLPVGDSDMMGGIPQIDISGDTSRQTVVDHVPDWYLGHPDTVLMGDGQTIFVVYPLEHGGPTVLRKSTDGGKTWSERLPVPENWSRTADVPTIFRLIDPEGTERLIVFQNMAKPGAEPRPANAQKSFDLSYSEDGGETWTPFAPTGLQGQVSPNTVVPISGGRYLTVFQLNAKIEMAISSDGGLTWHSQRTIASHPDAALVEPAAVKSPDGSEIAVLIRENSRKYNSMLIVSRDEGRTWSQPVELPDTLTGDRHMPRYAPDGRLVITLRDVKEGSPTYGDFVAWVGTYEDLVNLRPGKYRVRLLENKRNWWDTGYAGLELLPDGTFVSTTYVPLTHGAKPSVVSLRYGLDELDALVAEEFGPEVLQ